MTNQGNIQLKRSKKESAEVLYYPFCVPEKTGIFFVVFKSILQRGLVYVDKNIEFTLKGELLNNKILTLVKLNFSNHL